MSGTGTSESEAGARSPAGETLGERLRRLRLAAGLTQTELAAGRFSKEYVSQIERGKTRPTADTVAWLAERLGVDAELLATGVSGAERSRLEAQLARAEALAEQYRYEEAAAACAGMRPDVERVGAVDLELRCLLAEGWARLHLGDLRPALSLLQEARALAEDPRLSDLHRADALYRLGVCRYRLSSVSTAVALLDQALLLADRSGLPCDLLRVSILSWRSRCYRRQRDFLAAREDVERALELAQGLSDRRALAGVYFQASLVAEREGHWALARTYAERAKAYYEELAERYNVGRLLNNLGGLTYSLGRPEEAVGYLKDALRILLDEGGEDVEAAHVLCSLAEVQLGLGQATEAETQARKALELLDGRVDYLEAIGTAQLALGRALLDQGRWDEAQETLVAADRSFEQLSSVSHRAAAWIALGDVAARRGDDRGAARLYRRAAEALQDFRF